MCLRRKSSSSRKRNSFIRRKSRRETVAAEEIKIREIETGAIEGEAEEVVVA